MTPPYQRENEATILNSHDVRLRALEASVHPIIAREQLDSGGTTNIADGVAADLPWSLSSGDSLLDLTTPTDPVIITSGIYAVTVDVQGIALTTGGTFAVKLLLDGGGDNASVFASSPPSTTGFGVNPEVSIAMTYYIPAGGRLQVNVENRDGVSDRDFSMNNAIVQRIT